LHNVTFFYHSVSGTGTGVLPALDDGEGWAGYRSRGRFLNAIRMRTPFSQGASRASWPRMARLFTGPGS